MTGLSATARAAIREAGIPLAEWMRMWGYAGTTWGGDRCGCFDDRCIGHHHEGADGCGCLETMISDAIAWRRATRSINSVELAGGPYGLFQWVSVSTPAVLATVSTSRGSIGPTVNGVLQERPAESVVRVETRAGWSPVVTHEERHGIKEMVIRFVKAPVIIAAEEAAPTAEGTCPGGC